MLMMEGPAVGLVGSVAASVVVVVGSGVEPLGWEAGPAIAGGGVVLCGAVVAQPEIWTVASPVFLPRKNPVTKAANTNVTHSTMVIVEFFTTQHTSFIDYAIKNWYNFVYLPILYTILFHGTSLPREIEDKL